MYKICFYTPKEYAEKIKVALFEIGVGKIGNYDCCSWETEGTGQFRALEGSNPFIGKEKEIERLAELKIEMVCEDDLIRKAVATLKKAHPYETPAYEIYKLEEY